MRWNISIPKEGDVREHRRFAWFPVTDPFKKQRIWLEFYGVHQRYGRTMTGLGWLDTKIWSND